MRSKLPTPVRAVAAEPQAHPDVRSRRPRVDAAMLLNALPNPVLAIDHDDTIVDANGAAEIFFETGLVALRRQRLTSLLPPASPILSLVTQAREREATINEYRIDLGNPRIGMERLVDVHLAPLTDIAGGVIMMLQERTIADKMDRQLTYRGAARSVSGLAAMLAHEIKNPLSGIRGAAQLLETGLSDEDRMLTRLICDETDRIVNLVTRMDLFSDERPIHREGVNVHRVLDHVKQVARAGFARHINFVESYDPSLPPVFANRDQLVQVFLNLAKNAAEAIGPDAVSGEIEFSSAYRPGVRLRTSGSRAPVALPLEICVRDNGPGVSDDILPHLFDPFVTTKSSGSGLGLALVAKIIGDHGGIIECETQPRRTTFRILLPVYREEAPRRRGARREG
jgi:two-component system nitrogen regulation sensor histidine kinase GlnL